MEGITKIRMTCQTEWTCTMKLPKRTGALARPSTLFDPRKYLDFYSFRLSVKPLSQPLGLVDGMEISS